MSRLQLYKSQSCKIRLCGQHRTITVACSGGPLSKLTCTFSHGHTSISFTITQQDSKLLAQRCCHPTVRHVILPRRYSQRKFLLTWSQWLSCHLCCSCHQPWMPWLRWCNRCQVVINNGHVYQPAVENTCLSFLAWAAQ